jgi:hypothetical protein
MGGGGRLKEKFGSKLRRRMRNKGQTTEALKQAPSQDPPSSHDEPGHPDYASVESSPWGTFESHQEIHKDGFVSSSSSNGSNHKSPKGWTISTGPVTTTTTTITEEGKDETIGKPASSRRANRKWSSSSSHILKKTPPFQRLCRSAFAIVDSDKSGQVDKQELYTGLLLVHLRLAAYVGPAACRPVTRDQADTLFDLMDVDHSGTISEQEFGEVMIVLCSSIVSRVVLLFTMTIFLIPILARNILSFFLQLYENESLRPCATALWTLLMKNPIIVRTTSMTQTPLFHALYSAYTTSCNGIAFLLGKLPKTLLDTMPFTLLSSILGSLLIPWCLLKIDGFFETLAKRDAAKTKKEE